MANLSRANPVWLVLLFWAGFCGVAIFLSHGGAALDTDGAMRLSEIRDLLHGQSWFDTAQHRMDVPYGLPMHWSRLVDAPLAGLMLFFRLFLTPAAAENMAITVWPAFPFLAVLLALWRIARFGGGQVIVLLLAVSCAAIFDLFTPGAIDHHNVQIALTLWTIALLLEASPWAALTIALSLAVGMETLPYALTAIAIVVVRWLRAGDHLPARHFALILVAASLVLLFGTTALRYRFAPACDTYSFFYAVLLVAGASGFASLTFADFSMRQRGLAIIALGVVLIGLAAILNVRCLGGPYGQMDPRLNIIFLSRINEARGAGSFAGFAPSEFFSGYIYALLCVGASLAMLWRRASIVCVFGVVALVISSLQVREVPFAILIGLPGLAALVAEIFTRRGILAATLAFLLLNDTSFALAGAAMEPRRAARIQAFNQQVDCASPAAIQPLTRLPQARVAAFVDQGPAILVATRDTVIAGPYHRDGDGILDTYAIFTGSAEQAHAILKRRGINYLMTCAAAPDWDYYIGHGGPESLLARIAVGREPDWLVPVEQDAATQTRLYRVEY